MGRGRRGGRAGRPRSGGRLPGQLGAGGDGGRGGQGGGGGARRGGGVGGDRPGGAGGGAAPGRGRGRGGRRRAGRRRRPPRWASRWPTPAAASRRASAPCDSTRSWLRCAAGGPCTAGATRSTSWPAAARRGRRDHPVERPGGGLLRAARRGPGHRQRGALQAERADPGDRLAAGQGAGLGAAGRGAVAAHRRRRGGRGAGRRRRWTWSRTSAPPPPAGRSPRPAARTGAKVLLENGGSDPLVVDADVDPVWAAGQAALGAFANAGQICVAVERIYVHRDVAEDFVDALVERAEALRTGPGRDPGTELGPLVDRRHRDHVHGQVTAAVARGGAGAHRRRRCRTGRGRSTRRPWSPTAGTTCRWSARRPSGRSPRWWWWTRSPRRCAAPPTRRTGWPPRCSPGR